MDHKLHTSTVKAKDRKNAILSRSFPITAEFHLCLIDSHISYSALALILVVPLFVHLDEQHWRSTFNKAINGSVDLPNPYYSNYGLTETERRIQINHKPGNCTAVSPTWFVDLEMTRNAIINEM